MQKCLPSLFKSSIPQFQCPKHPAKTIHSLCLHIGCTTPYICKECEIKHPKNHTKLFQPISGIYNDKILAQYAKVLDSDFSLKNLGSRKDKMFMILKNFEEEFRQIISKMMQAVGDSFETLKAEIERRKSTLRTFEQIKHVLKMDNIDDKHLRELVGSYRLAKQESIADLDIDFETLSSTFKK